ncbi:MAG: mechanosensitive ion channel family protein [Gammaproteobacteria bacterium]|nr:mechanosensitive ion channel family protein [Gammaproteobacteria bacterium]
MDIEQLIPGFTFFKEEGVWVSQIFIIVFSVLLFNYFQRRILTRLHKTFENTKNPWDDAVIGALRRPLTALIWILGISFAAQIVGQRTDAEIFQVVSPARDVGVIVVITWFLIRFVRLIEDNVIENKRQQGKEADITTIDAIAKLLRVSVMITATLVALQTLGFSVSGVLAFGGVGGIAIGFAAKDLLANFFGGLMIYLDRPFSVGDWIRSPDRDIEGTVENIGWRLTRIRTFDQRPLYVPNSTFANIAVENPSRMKNRRIYETMGIRYDDVGKMADIVAEVKEMLQSHPAIDTKRTLMVNFNAFAVSSVDFFVYTFTHTIVWAEFHEIKQDVLLKIINIIEKHGAQMAFPTSTIHIPDEIAVRQGGVRQDA